MSRCSAAGRAETLKGSHADPAQEALKARVGTKRIEFWVHFHEGHPHRSLVESLVKPRKSLLVITKSNVNVGEVKSRYVFVTRSFLQLIQDSQRFVIVPGFRVNVSHGG